MGAKIITISRQYGSGGRAIGELAAKKLGYAFYDKEIIAKAAEKTGFAESFIKKYGEQRNTGMLLSIPFAGNNFNGMSAEDYLWSIQRKIILELAEEGPCVIVGRCADYILQERDDALHVFIHANEEDKIRRIKEEYGDDAANPRKRLLEMDKNRSRNYRYYTDQEWGRASNYSMSLNTSVFGIEDAVDIILELAEKMNK